MNIEGAPAAPLDMLQQFDILPAAPVSSCQSTPDSSPPACKVFDIPELLENILLLFSDEDSESDTTSFIASLFMLLRVNKVFQNTIEGSRKLLRRMGIVHRHMKHMQATPTAILETHEPVIWFLTHLFARDDIQEHTYEVDINGSSKDIAFLLIDDYIDTCGQWREACYDKIHQRLETLNVRGGGEASWKRMLASLYQAQRPFTLSFAVQFGRMKFTHCVWVEWTIKPGDTLGMIWSKWSRLFEVLEDELERFEMMGKLDWYMDDMDEEFFDKSRERVKQLSDTQIGVATDR